MTERDVGCNGLSQIRVKTSNYILLCFPRPGDRIYIDADINPCRAKSLYGPIDRADRPIRCVARRGRHADITVQMNVEIRIANPHALMRPRTSNLPWKLAEQVQRVSDPFII